MRTFSEACERNKQPISNVLLAIFKASKSVLEIGSGTGQHAIYFAQQLPHLNWHPSDQSHYLDGLKQNVQEATLTNLNPPFQLNVNQENWSPPPIDAIFSANTLHIMNTSEVETFFSGASKHLSSQENLVIYGPFNQNGQFTSEGNRKLDIWIQKAHPGGGIKDLEWVLQVAKNNNFLLNQNHDLPANNRLLHFYKT